MRGENGDGFSDNNISWCKEGGKEGGKEVGGCLARSTPLAPSPSLFLSEEMPAGTAATAFMYLLGEPVLGGEGGEGKREVLEREKERERAEEDHHLVPVRPCVCACKCLPPSPSRSFPPPRTRRRRAGWARARTTALNNQQKTIVAPKGMFGSWKKWTVVEPLIRRWGKANIRHRFGKDSSQSLSKAPYSS